MARNGNVGRPIGWSLDEFASTDLDAVLVGDLLGAPLDEIAGGLLRTRLLDTLEHADALAAADLALHARPLDADWRIEAPGTVEPLNVGTSTEAPTTALDFGFARPDFKGNGRGNGRNKDKSDTGGTTEPTDPTDTGSTPDPTAPTEPTGGSETNTGSTDPNTYVSGLDTPNGFNIEIAFTGSWSNAQKQAFLDASERISDIVTGDLPAHNGIDDLRITATLTSIDGAGGYWGWGGYTSARSDSKLPSEGYMRFDTADADQVMGYGMWDDLVFHEMMHTLGFGTAWSSMGLVRDAGSTLRFTGANAIEAYHDVFSGIAAADAFSFAGVPVETDGGSGTAGVHWDDATFRNEIMTGTLRFDDSFSDMSIAALEDMGYETIYGGTDALIV